MTFRRYGLVAGSLLLLACSGEPLQMPDTADAGLACTANVEPGIWVHLYDRATGERLFLGRGFVRSGTYTDTLRPNGDGVYVTADEHRGTFTLHVEQVGYIPFERSGIVVTGGRCHVNPAVVYVTLVADR